MPEFPLYLVEVDGIKRFISKNETARLLSSWFSKVDLKEIVLEENLYIRDLTKEEHNALIDLADEIDASK